MFLVFFILFLVAGGVFSQTIAQEGERAKNTIAASFGIIGADLSYERMFNRYLSVLADASYTTLVLVDEFTVSGKGRVYPFGGAFYLEAGLGFSYGRGLNDFMKNMILGVLTFGWYLTTLDDDEILQRKGGFLIQPGLGWKIDIGKDDAFVLPINLGLDIRARSGELPDMLPYLRIGLGYSF